MSDIRKVILYKHGVGYFEKHIHVKSRQSIDLFFKTREMNDVLKSLTIIDLGGGIISSVSYDSVTPAEKLLEDISIRIPDEHSLKSLLSQIKGAKIELLVGSESFQGVVVGLDPLIRRENEVVIESDRLTILDEKGEMASFSTEEIKSIRILDENIRKDLEFYLKTIIFSQKKDQKKLTIFANGEGEREILTSYVLESPVWKTTYRVVLNPESAPLIQGWAVVDNTQDEDWEDIELSLVSGLPVSFVHDLYNPRFKRRPVVKVQDEVSLAPPTFEEGYDMEGYGPPKSDDEEAARFKGGMPAQTMALGRARSAPMGAAGAVPMLAELAAPMKDLISSVEVKTISQKVGDHFEYRIMNPVTIKRNQSALVPIIHQEFKGEKILIFNERNRPNNPMISLEMTNDTGLTLESGPVTIYERDTYMGESMLEFTKPDEKKYVSYAVELGCHIERIEFSNDEPVFMVTIAGGTMQAHYYRVREKTYRIKYKNHEAAKLIIEHPREQMWELVDTAKPIEITQSYYRFQYDLPREGEYSFPIKEKKIFWTHYTLTSLTEENILFFLDQKYFDTAIAGKVRQLIALQTSKIEMEREINYRKGEIDKIFKDQERLRSNLGTLSNSREEQSLKERFISKMSEQENLIELHEKHIQELQARVEKSTQEIGSFLISLQFEKKLR